ncbi:uncharacterized protein CIMG_04083 [Coccidioides immitis RS]|uniref:Pre-rRNA processing protein n=1 Tax=Coccidioides immitis (strain RS) TaxID=246410 RepID=J3KCR3_COCIM|nr:uncharacterized protein CIMG_04083 [Coccidioides immitis RS]EAS33059.3 hypothetical protein CIMG_04083 [Coccidioides immitis RS]TPX19986.1 hypothetical protein DIZ76_017781 [Coccidioides immitis]
MAGAGDESAPLLARSASPSLSRHSSYSKKKSTSDRNGVASETTPLLSGEHQRSSRDEDHRSIASSARSGQAVPGQQVDKKARRVRWPIVISLASLCLAVIAILVLGFAAPATVEEYAKEAAIVEPVGISIAAFTSSGVRTRIQASFSLDSSRVKKPIVRNIGRLTTWFGKEVESGESDIQVYLPEYGNILLGTATIPPIKVNIQDGHKNSIDFLADLKAGDVDGIRGVANDWLEGRLGHLRIKGVASVPLRSGLLQLGFQHISETFVLQDQDLPNFPDFNITKLNVHEFQLPGERRAVAADISLHIQNVYAVEATVPALTFEIMVPNCAPGDEYIRIGNATSDTIEIEPKRPVLASVTGFIYEVPDALITICPGKTSSPLDLLVQSYIKGRETFVYVRGGSLTSPTLPDWLEAILQSVIVPVSIPSKGLSNLIKRFSMSHVHFFLPEPSAKPDAPEAQPRVSALVQALVDLPQEMNVPVNVSRVRTVADVYYHSKKLGYIDLQKWQNATVRHIKDELDNSPALLVEFDIEKAPLRIVDEAVFADVIKKVILAGETVSLQVKANVAAELDTALGKFVIRDIPASGDITVKAPLTGGLGNVNPKIDSIKISHTTESTISLQAVVNFTNPTNYSADIPFIDMKLAYNGSSVAHIMGENLSIFPGHNSFVKVQGLWNPADGNGQQGVISGRDLISRYISGLNTTVTISPHNGSIPFLPELGKALSTLGIEIPVPKLRLPDQNGDGDDDGDNPDGGDGPHFIKDATMHLWTSTAEFTLLSPLTETTLFITSVHATALYNSTSPVGRIQYNSPFPVPPGVSITPRLPVELDFGGAGYEALKKALGGSLEIDAVADIGVKLGEYMDTISYWGKGIGAKVRL